MKKKRFFKLCQAMGIQRNDYNNYNKIHTLFPYEFKILDIALDTMVTRPPKHPAFQKRTKKAFMQFRAGNISAGEYVKIYSRCYNACKDMMIVIKVGNPKEKGETNG